MTFVPRFTAVESLLEAADMINKPHEDYPRRVTSTLEAIQDVLRIVRHPSISLYTIRCIHQYVMADLRDAGYWRMCEVQIGSDMGMPFVSVPSAMSDLHPYQFETIEELFEWYRQFQIIHPFSDGNGRVGGILVAAMGCKFHNVIYAPLQ